MVEEIHDALPETRWIRPALIATAGLSVFFFIEGLFRATVPVWQDLTVQGAFLGLATVSILLWLTRNGVRRVHITAFILAIACLSWYFSFADPAYRTYRDPVTVVSLPLILAAVFWRLRETALLAVASIIAGFAVAFSAGTSIESAEALITSLVLFSGFALGANFIIEQERSGAQRANRETKHGKAMLNNLVANIDEGLVSVNGDGIVEAMNPAAGRMIAKWCDSPPSVGQAFDNCLPQELRNPYALAGAGERQELSFYAGDVDDLLQYEAILTPFSSKDFARPHVVLVLRDVSETAKVRAMVDQARADGSRDVLNMVSHQLSTPLTPIIIKTHMLLDPANGVDERHRPSVETIQRNALRTLHMVEAIIEATRGSPESSKALREISEFMKK